jgi:hypothetical protein
MRKGRSGEVREGLKMLVFLSGTLVDFGWDSGVDSMPGEMKKIGGSIWNRK